MTFLGVTLARGGSKGLPGKNIRVIAGKPLLRWTIDAAKASKLLNNYIVSTEDPDITLQVLEAGAILSYRPEYLAGDKVNRFDVLRYIVTQFPWDIYDAVVLLQPTSPIRREGLVDECIRDFTMGGYDSLATGYMFQDMDYRKNNGANRQDMPAVFIDDGNCYIWKTELIRRGDRYGANVGTKVISRRENIDINDEFDFWVAEQVLSHATF